MIRFGARGASFVVLHGDVVVSRYETIEAAEAAAHRLAAVFGGVVEALPAAPESVRPRAPEEPRVVVRAAGIDLPDDFAEVVHLTIPALRTRLAVGDLDAHLVALAAAERMGRGRAGALDAIADRARLVGAVRASGLR